MSGQTSAIQKTALLGSEAKRRVAIFSEGNTTSKEGLGLLDLLKIKFPIEEGKSWVSPKMTLNRFCLNQHHCIVMIAIIRQYKFMEIVANHYYGVME